MKHTWKDWFSFSTRERRGIVMLAMVLVSINGTRIWMNLSSPTPKETLTPNYMQIITRDSAREHYSSLPTQSARFHFNPNELSKEKWTELGLNERQVNGIMRYKASGGKFKYREDIHRIYSLDSITAESLIPYIDLPARDNGFQHLDSDSMRSFVSLFNAHGQQTKNYNLKFELNEVDSTQLRLVPGIGAFFARNIIKYRNALGGFADTLQLLEVWKMTPAKMAQIHHFFEVNPNLIKKIKINSVSVDDLRMHPYLNFNQAKVVVAYREKHGNYNKLSDLLNTHIIPAGILSKLEPYLDFSPGGGTEIGR
jgi:competence protein ComEA